MTQKNVLLGCLAMFYQLFWLIRYVEKKKKKIKRTLRYLLFSEDWKKPTNQPNKKTPIIEAYFSMCKYFLFVQLRKVGMLSEPAYGREPFEKLLRNNFHFLQ